MRYAKALQYQTHQITSNRTIVLQNISEAAMYYLEDHIKAIGGVKDMLPARDVASTGRHNILGRQAGIPDDPVDPLK
jgi:hypothetical protein